MSDHTTRRPAVLTPQRAAEFRKAASRGVPTRPIEDGRSRPSYHAARGMATLPGGARKRQIKGVQ